MPLPYRAQGHAPEEDPVPAVLADQARGGDGGLPTPGTRVQVRAGGRAHHYDQQLPGNHRKDNVNSPTQAGPAWIVRHVQYAACCAGAPYSTPTPPPAHPRCLVPACCTGWQSFVMMMASPAQNGACSSHPPQNVIAVVSWRWLMMFMMMDIYDDGGDAMLLQAEEAHQPGGQANGHRPRHQPRAVVEALPAVVSALVRGPERVLLGGWGRGGGLLLWGQRALSKAPETASWPI